MTDDRTLTPGTKEIPTSNERPQGPLWTPTREVERMMRNVSSCTLAVMEIDRKVLEGLLHDSLLWRQERAAQKPHGNETGERRTQDEQTLRRLLAFAYSGSALYGDDGELQDGRHPMIDYVRDSVADIERKIHERGMAKLAAAACPECRYVIGHKAGCSSEKADPPRGAKARDFVEYDPYGGVRVDMARYLRSPAGQAQLQALGGKKAGDQRLATDEIRDLACCDRFVRSSASEFCDECGYTNLDHLRKRSSQGKEVGR